MRYIKLFESFESVDRDDIEDRILIEAYLETVIKQIKKEAIEEHTKEEKYFQQFHPPVNRR